MVYIYIYQGVKKIRSILSGTVDSYGIHMNSGIFTSYLSCSRAMIKMLSIILPAKMLKKSHKTRIDPDWNHSSSRVYFLHFLWSLVVISSHSFDEPNNPRPKAHSILSSNQGPFFQKLTHVPAIKSSNKLSNCELLVPQSVH